jgi:rhodanese-related sulfurtransferase
MNTIIIDVREEDEFDAEHVENSIHIPLSSFEKQAPAIFKTFHGQNVMIMCRSGKRAGIATQQAARFSEGVQLEVFKGGILEWKNQGKPTIASKKSHLPIMRQVQLAAGSLALTGAVLAYWVSPNFIFLTGFVGAGLAVAGATGFCGMAEILARMPWNKGTPELSKEVCAVSPASRSCNS